MWGSESCYFAVMVSVSVQRVWREDSFAIIGFCVVADSQSRRQMTSEQKGELLTSQAGATFLCWCD